MGKPVLNLDYLLTKIVQQEKPLDWPTFLNHQINNTQPLKVRVCVYNRFNRVVSMSTCVSHRSWPVDCCPSKRS